MTMPQSLVKLYAHLIFSTKNRQPFMDEAIRPQVHGYLATVVREMGSPWVVVGGVADHVHVLFDLGKLRPPVEYVEQIKRTSSKFIKTIGTQYQNFYWQRGYAIFSVGPAHRDEAEHYVRHQDEHHRAKSFQEELRGLLERYGVPYDGRFVWD
jgi:putative transposase